MSLGDSVSVCEKLQTVSKHQSFKLSHYPLGAILDFTGFPHTAILADDQGNGFVADIDSSIFDVRFSSP